MESPVRHLPSSIFHPHLKMERPIIIATRGSALALAQAQAVLAQCRAAFPRLRFEQKIIKTTGDKLLTASLANPDKDLPKGLFTKELEVALVKRQADLAVHSLKDLPTELPSGLALGAVGKRADVLNAGLFAFVIPLHDGHAPQPPQHVRAVQRQEVFFQAAAGGAGEGARQQAGAARAGQVDS